MSKLKSTFNKNHKIDYSDYYKNGGLIKTKISKEAKKRLYDSDGTRKIDLKSIKYLTKYLETLPQTKELNFNKTTGKYTAKRLKLHKSIIEGFKGDLVCIERKKPIAILMGGSPASGKSTFLKKYAPYLLKEEIFRIDADEVRSKLPEYDGFNASQTHLETKDIVDTLLSDRVVGMPCLFDVIYDGTMNSVKKYLPLIQILKDLDYKIFVVYVDNVPKAEIIRRNLERYKKSGRFVPLEVVDDFFDKGKTALNQIKEVVDGYMVVDGADNYKIINLGGSKLPRDRKYSAIGQPLEDFKKEKIKTNSVSFKNGGNILFNPDDNKLINQAVSGSGNTGGMLVGNRHVNNGIKAINISTGQPIEMEGGEVVITRNAVSDSRKRSFNGKMMTNREILSFINVSGNGVSFAKGGDVPEKIEIDVDGQFELGGETMCGKDVMCNLSNNARTFDEKLDDNYIEDIFAEGGDISDKYEFIETLSITFIKDQINDLREKYQSSSQSLTNFEKGLSIRKIKKYENLLYDEYQKQKSPTMIIENFVKSSKANFGNINLKRKVESKEIGLTEEELQKAKTIQFENWFGDWQLAKETGNNFDVSKAVNYSGYPLVVYHGTDTKFASWQTYSSNNLHYFSVKKDFAEFFAKSWGERTDKAAKDSSKIKDLNFTKGNYVFPCFIRIKNPIDLSPFLVNKYPLKVFIQYIEVKYDMVFDFKVDNMLLRDSNTEVFAWQLIRFFQSFNLYIKNETPFDGIIFYEFNPEKPKNSIDDASLCFTTFDSEQNKFVNAETFDFRNSDSRFKKGGKLIQ